MTVLLALGVLWLVAAAVVFPPRPWQTRHPGRALRVWEWLLALGYAGAAVTLGVILLDATRPPALTPGSEWRVVVAWVSLAIVGAVASLVLTRREHLCAKDSDADGALRALRGSAAYYTEQRTSCRVTYLLSDHPMACADPNRGEVLVTSGLAENLTAAELDAVVAHEVHHLQARHPWLVRLARLHAACIPLRPVRAVHGRAKLLVELDADDRAAGCHGSSAISALERIADLTGNPSAALRAYRLRVHRDAARLPA